MEQRAHLYTLAGVCALPRALSPHRELSPRSDMAALPQQGAAPLAPLRGYPCTPTKTVHPPRRLYYFCGFYYPIREVIPIAIYHCNIGIVSRGKGKSAVAAAAYRSGEKITNEWDGMTHDYTRKRGVVHTEILLPPHAPPSFSDRAALWNSVELYEKAGNAQLAREIDAALPIELSREEQIRLVREYCSSQFVSRGMCVDFAIHDTGSGNPHCHIMLTMRPLDERGAWAAKSKKEYDLDENGERIRLPSGRYKTHKVDLTGWNDKGNALLWRKAWADISNAYLERAGSRSRIDHRSNAERGIDELPTVHMGVAACQMEKKGIAHRERRAEPEYPKGKPPYPGNPGADWKAQRMDWRAVQGAGNRPRTAAAISQPRKSVDEVFERSERKESEVFAALATTAHSR